MYMFSIIQCIANGQSLVKKETEQEGLEIRGEMPYNKKELINIHAEIEGESRRTKGKERNMRVKEVCVCVCV